MNHLSLVGYDFLVHSRPEACYRYQATNIQGSEPSDTLATTTAPPPRLTVSTLSGEGACALFAAAAEGPSIASPAGNHRNAHHVASDPTKSLRLIAAVLSLYTYSYLAHFALLH